MIELAVISDLHVGPGSRAADLWPSGTTETGLDAEFTQKFIRFIADNKIRPDYLVLPGDVSHSGQPDELFLASERLAAVIDALGLTEEKVFFVPGNHDIDWGVMTLGEDVAGFRRSQRYHPLRNQAWMFDRVLRAADRHLLDDPHCYCLWDRQDILVLGLNTVSHDSQNEKVHHGWVPQSTIDEVHRALAGCPIRADQVRLCLLHHHPVQYSDPIPDEPDFSVLTNAGNLLALLRDERFDVLVHGHKHAPRFSIHSTDGSSRLGILGAGSFSARLDPRWSGLVNNQFHLLKISGRGLEGHAKGALHSWTYLSGHGWQQSARHNGIDHVIPFGSHLTHGRLSDLITSQLPPLLSASAYVPWASMIALEPDLAHVQPEVTRQLLDELGPRLGFVRHGDPPEPFILLRRERQESHEGL